MKPISDKTEIAKYQALVSEMTVNEYEFNVQWIRQTDWKVVPVEDGAHFAEENISGFVSGLRGAGYTRCLAVATEPLGDMPPCYRLSISEADFREFNRVCGAFRFVLTDEERSWAISCNEWYLLFAGEESLLEAALQMPIPTAREKFMNFARPLAKGDAADPLLKVAQHYAQL